MTARRGLTLKQRAAMLAVTRCSLRAPDAWYRAGTVDELTGAKRHPRAEAVSLASLHGAGILMRRPWRGAEGERDAAYEYRLEDSLLATVRAHLGSPPIMITVHVHSCPCAPITGCAICYPSTRELDARPLSKCRRCGAVVEHEVAPASTSTSCPRRLGKSHLGACGGQLVPLAGVFVHEGPDGFEVFRAMGEARESIATVPELADVKPAFEAWRATLPACTSPSP